MIVSYSTVEDIGAGFRERLFAPRWNIVAERLKAVDFPKIHSVRVRLIIGHVQPKCIVHGFETETKFVVETRIPIEEFKQLSIGEKYDRVLDTIFESIKAAYAHFGDQPPSEIDQIWQEARAQGERRELGA